MERKIWSERDTAIMFIPHLFLLLACDQRTCNTLIAVGVFVLFMLLLYIVRTPHTFVLCLMSIWDYYAKSYPGRFDLDAN